MRTNLRPIPSENQGNAKTSIADSIVKAVREIYREPTGRIPLHAPCFKRKELEFVRECLDTGWVSSVGRYVDKFERMICEFTGAAHAVATVNGTAAIHIALALAGVRPGEEVLCPAFTFVGTVSPVVHVGAFPLFMDSDPQSLGLDLEKLRRFLSGRCIRKDGLTYDRKTGRTVRACIAMHPYGFPLDMDPLLELCGEANIYVIEDSAEALGSYYKERHCGTIGEVGILSFNGNKIITTGGGGMVLTNDAECARRAKHLTTTAKVDNPWEYVHDEVGYNYRLPNLNAALGCAQMDKLPEFLAQKASQAKRLGRLLRGEKELKVVAPQTGTPNHWLNLVSIPPREREGILRELNNNGIQARASWYPICDMPPYRRFGRFEVQGAWELYESVICIPNGILPQTGAARKKVGGRIRR